MTKKPGLYSMRDLLNFKWPIKKKPKLYRGYLTKFILKFLSP
jgi:hypothetical protein